MRKYNFGKVEKYWQRQWQKDQIYEPDLAKAKRPFYNLMMFPYPSAEGLHVGNMYAFTGADIYGRFKRMQGYDVFEPIGLDGFGIHSENYALKIGVNPMEQSKISEKRFYEQLRMIGNGFAWDEQLETYDPEYYKWTQWIFVQMWKHGLAYRKKQSVNWCPSCKTVLADEQVISGRCERCRNEVIKKELEQWLLRITKYAEKLLGNLEKIDWSEKVKIAQRNWIGKSEGAEITFPIKDSDYSVKVFTTRPDTLFGATYMVLAPEHPLISNLKSQISNYREVEAYVKKAGLKPEADRIAEKKEKTGIELKGVKAINPANKGKIPIFVADYVLSSYGTGAIMAVPAHDGRDFEFAKKFGLKITEVISPPESKGELWEDEGKLVNSGEFSGMDSEKAKWEITKFVDGKRQIQYRLRDWLISRQRYWGTPIPMIYCEKCVVEKKGERKEMPGWYAVPEKNLPVKLPYVKHFRPRGKGESPLASVKEFYEVKCPRCGAKARRETDVSDTFLDSAWYYLRYPSLHSANAGTIPWDGVITKHWLPVNMYIGGAEHSVLHLLYVRFVSLALHDMGVLKFGDSNVPIGEPFPKFRAHGLLISEGAKMSKSRGNVVVPDEYIKKFGVDTLRMYLMFLAPFEQGGDFRDAGILGIARFLERVWRFGINANISRFHQGLPTKSEQMNANNPNKEIERLLHKTIKKVTDDTENLRYNTAISALMILLNEAEKNQQSCNFAILRSFLKLLAPFAPHISEELWHQLGNKTSTPLEIARPKGPKGAQARARFLMGSIHKEPWPKYDPKLIEEKTFTLIIQINGKVRDQMEVKKGINQEGAEKLVLDRERVKIYLKSREPKKVIFVKDRLINIVI